MSDSIAEFESRLIPIMREGVEVVKMIGFRKLADSLAARQVGNDEKFRAMLTGAVINRVFGTPNNQEPFVSFAAENRDLIDQEVNGIGLNCEEMRIPFTDALRMQAICDRMDGAPDEGSLVVAREAGILIEDRDLPLPHKFMELVRRIGSAYGLIIPPLPADK